MIDRRQLLAGAAAGFLGAALPVRSRAAEGALRLGSVKFGSLSWLIETIRAEGLDKKVGLDLEVVEVASNQAGPVALLAGGADVIVSDWTWAMRQRALGEKVKFSPYSSALGALVVPAASPIKDLSGLEGKTLGVAGSNIDKSWLLLRAYAKKKLGRDMAEFANPSFGAAPLLAEEIRAGRLEAELNFWTFAARLNGQGFRTVITVAEIMKDLGIDPVPSLVGFIWKEDYEAKNPEKVKALLDAAHAGNDILAKNDAAWDRLKPLIKPGSDAEMAAIMAGYRAGIPKPWGEGELRSAEKLMQVLVDAGDAELMGHGTTFDAKLFHHATG